MFRRESALHCTGCGTRRDEWERDMFAYVADPFTCPGCEILEQERNNIPEDQRSPAIKIPLIPREQATAPGQEPNR